MNTKTCSTNKNPLPPCPKGRYIQKKNKKGEECCYKLTAKQMKNIDNSTKKDDKNLSPKSKSTTKSSDNSNTSDNSKNSPNSKSSTNSDNSKNSPNSKNSTNFTNMSSTFSKTVE